VRGTYKNPTEDASPAPGGTGLPREGRKPVRDALGIGSDPSRQGRGPPPPLAGRVRRRPPPLAGRVGAPHGANPSRQGRGRRICHPHGSDSTSEPTPPIDIRGGATIPYIYKGIVRSYEKSRSLNIFDI